MYQDIKQIVMNDIRTFTIDEFNKQMQQPTLHPEVAVIDPARLEDDGTLCFTGNFYAIRFVQTRCGEARYGRKCADFQYGTLVFTKPGDIVRVCREDAVDGSISGILFHPELFSTKSLVFKKTDYTFFDYRENEALHLSLQEKRIVQDRLEHIHEELRRDIDRHSLRLVSAGLELLLDYCVRFYERQFACRTDIDTEYMEKLDKTLARYFSIDGLKSVEGGIIKIESALSSLSPAYLNDFVRAETGKTLAEYVRIKMMEYIKKRVCKEGFPLEQVADRTSTRLFVVADPDADILYESATVRGDSIVCILPETAPAFYLEYLQKKGISYLFAGSKGDDLRTAMHTLAETFGVESLSLQGGGIIDGAFLQAGLIDELSLVIYPGIDGSAGSTSIFHYIGKGNPSQGQSLELLSVKEMEDGVVWLRYKFHKNS